MLADGFVDPGVDMSALHDRLQEFVDLSSSDSAVLDGTLRQKVLVAKPREVLFAEGDFRHTALIVLEGWACQCKILPDGRRQILGICLPGDFCDATISVPHRADFSAVALTRTKVAEVDVGEYERIIQTHPNLARAFLCKALEHRAIQREWALSLGKRSALERVAHLFCEIYLRLHAINWARGNRCHLPLTQRELADATGLTTIHVNRTLQELRRCDLLEFSNSELVVPSLSRLQARARFDPSYLQVEMRPLLTA